MILHDYLLQKETDKSVKISRCAIFLKILLPQVTGGICFLHLKEKREGFKGWVPAERLCELYDEELKKMFGNSVEYTKSIDGNGRPFHIL